MVETVDGAAAPDVVAKAIEKAVLDATLARMAVPK